MLHFKINKICVTKVPLRDLIRLQRWTLYKTNELEGLYMGIYEMSD